MNVQKADNEVYKAYRVKTLKVFGRIQIEIGVACAILSFAEISIDSEMLSHLCCNDKISEYKIHLFYYSKNLVMRLFLATDITCLLCSGWVRKKN